MTTCTDKPIAPANGRVLRTIIALIIGMEVKPLSTALQMSARIGSIVIQSKPNPITVARTITP